MVQIDEIASRDQYDEFNSTLLQPADVDKANPNS